VLHDSGARLQNGHGVTQEKCLINVVGDEQNRFGERSLQSQQFLLQV
jgi:hypothetical protein